ncbi:16S rRNA (guanine(966)-N(2))-methyltransferase RsmD [Planctobacterium marinum]|uniref:16S rRNA (guanine(966)-N(2))-methyltransferase RsmD n=1 Tax=Planctobacterium marinum TaxID=1631968 RepID=UPI001E31168E|nr:16S rRNA (guanine(966)-N(2))-methyltransferase RsmD [Planctobacterium marinum]MCC2606638.1 16S rRNA (guanine(966)-N(2))-methyltransferase RsmD [Planctobacterium marinum]
MRAKQSASSKSAGFIRIISGKWRGRKLPVINSEGLRPTTDRTKETLFNWLMQDVANATCLDVFAGSGSLGLEALSRHARQVTLVEKQKDIAGSLRNIRTLLNADEQALQIVNQDALTWLGTCDRKFDIVFIDPPFKKNLLQPVVEALLNHNLLQDNALIYIEHEIELAWSIPASLQEIKRKNTRQVSSLLLQYQP